MFAYCLNNPVSYVDPLGESAYDQLSDYLQYGGGWYALPDFQFPDLKESLKALGTALIGLAGVSIASETVDGAIHKQKTKSYIVYLLADTQGNIRYVGRVTTSGYEARMNYHQRTRGLRPAKTFIGLDYSSARGLEEILMIELHLLNPSNPLNNQIHGIGPRNPNGSNYLAAAQEYLENYAEDSILNLFC